MDQAGGVDAVVRAVADVAIQVRVAAVEAAGVGGLPAAGRRAVPAGAVLLEARRAVSLLARVVEELIDSLVVTPIRSETSQVVPDFVQDPAE